MRGRAPFIALPVAVGAALFAYGAVAWLGPARGVEPVAEVREEFGPCDAGRWDVKVLADPEARTIGSVAIDSSVTELAALPAPRLGARTPRLESERQLVRIPVVFYADHLEPDRDIHLVVLDPSDPSASMIVELPDRSCLGKTLLRLRPSLVQARLDYERACGLASTEEGTYYVTGKATITGVRFFDEPERQFRRAPNAVEIHPVTRIEVNGPCAKFAGPTRFAIASSVADGGVLRSGDTWTAVVTGASVDRIASVDFLVDGVQVAHRTTTPWNIPGGVAARVGAPGAHHLAVLATLQDGSISRVTVSAQTRGRHPSARFSPSRVAAGGVLTVRLSGFVPRSSATVSVVRGRVVRIGPSGVRFGASGSAALGIRVPSRLQRGVYLVRVCQASCAAPVVAPVTIG